MITLHFHLIPQYKYELFHIYFTIIIIIMIMIIIIIIIIIKEKEIKIFDFDIFVFCFEYFVLSTLSIAFSVPLFTHDGRYLAFSMCL